MSKKKKRLVKDIPMAGWVDFNKTELSSEAVVLILEALNKSTSTGIEREDIIRQYRHVLMNYITDTFHDNWPRIANRIARLDQINRCATDLSKKLERLGKYDQKTYEDLWFDGFTDFEKLHNSIDRLRKISTVAAERVEKLRKVTFITTKKLRSTHIHSRSGKTMIAKQILLSSLLRLYAKIIQPENMNSHLERLYDFTEPALDKLMLAYDEKKSHLAAIKKIILLLKGEERT